MLYVVLLGTAGTFAAMFWQAILQVGLAAPAARQGPEILAGYVGGMGVMFALVAVLTPLATLIGSLIGGLVLHFCLWLVGGVKQPFEATYAVLAYATGSTTLFNLVPFCGGMIGAIWALVIEVIGLARVHDCGVGRAVLAVFLPMIVCCTAMGVLFFLFIGLGLASTA